MITTVFGQPGSAKTWSQIQRILSDAGKKGIAILDPQSSLCIRIMMFLLRHLRVVYYIRLRDIDRTLGFIHIKRSNATNPLQREQEDRQERMRIARLFLGRRALDLTSSPLIWEFLDWGLKLVQYSGAPLYFLKYAFQPHTNEFHWMNENCSDRETRQQFDFIKTYSKQMIRNELSPALRLVETVCSDPAFIGMCGTWDIVQAIRDKKIIILEGLGADRETIRTAILFIASTLLQAAEKDDLPLHLVIDELESFDLATPDMMVWLNTLRKQSVSITLITQSLGFDEIVKHKLLQASQRREWFRCGADMALIGSKDVGIPSLKRDSIWYQELRGRQVHNGYSEVDGKLVSQYAQVTEVVVHYHSFEDQIKMKAQEIMTLPVGTRLVNHFGVILKERVPLMEEPYPWGISEKKVEQWVTQIQQKPEYQTPTMMVVPERISSKNGSQSTRQRNVKSRGLAGSRAVKPATGRSRNGQKKDSFSK